MIPWRDYRLTALFIDQHVDHAILQRMANKKRIEEAYTAGYAAGLKVGNTSTLVSIRDWLSGTADNVPKTFPNIPDKATQDTVSSAIRGLAKVPAAALEKMGFKDPVDGREKA